MKRKINEAVQNFNNFVNKFDKMDSYFENMYYLYLAFGHFMQG